MSIRNATKIAVAMSLAAMLALCSAANAEQITLRVISGQPAEIYTAVSKKFMAVNPDISVTIEPVANDEEMIQAVLRGEIVGDAPDVAFPGFQALGLFSDRNLSANLDAFISDDAAFKDLSISPQMLELASFNNHVVGLPFGVSSPVLYFNADLVRQAGFDPANIPDDWASILSISSAITKLEQKPSGIYFDYYNVSGGQSFAALIMGFGGKLLNADRSDIAFDGPVGLQAFNQLRDMGAAGHVEMQSNQATQAFTAGSLGILMRSSVNTTRIEEQVGSRFPIVAKSIPIPSPSGTIPVGGKAVVMLTKDEQRQAAAWRFIKYAVGKDGQMQMATASGYTPINEEATSSLQETVYRGRPAYQITPSILPRIAKWDSFPGANAVKAVDTVRNYMQKVITLQVAPDQALEDLSKDVRTLIKQ